MQTCCSAGCTAAVAMPRTVGTVGYGNSLTIRWRRAQHRWRLAEHSLPLASQLERCVSLSVQSRRAESRAVEIHRHRTRRSACTPHPGGGISSLVHADNTQLQTQVHWKPVTSTTLLSRGSTSNKYSMAFYFFRPRYLPPSEISHRQPETPCSGSRDRSRSLSTPWLPRWRTSPLLRTRLMYASCTSRGRSGPPLAALGLA
jgi:hypothetical protein